MAISFISDSSATGASPLTVTAPASIADNDILVAFHWHDGGNADPTAPSGFTKWQSKYWSSGGYYASIWWKRASSESGNYSWTKSASSTTACIMSVYRGCYATGDPAEYTTSYQYQTSDTNIIAGSCTPTVETALLWLAWVGNTTITAPTSPASFNNREDLTFNSTWHMVEADILDWLPTWTGPIYGTAGATTAANKHAFLVALKMAAAITVDASQSGSDILVDWA